MFNTTNLNRIYVMLGTKCNLHCKYCMQEEVKCESKIKDALKCNYKERLDFVNFITRIALDQKRKKPLNIMFWGGEPLVYFDTISVLIHQMEKVMFNYYFRYAKMFPFEVFLGSKITFSVVTNGKLLNEEIVDFLNDKGFNVAISWDGKVSNDTRGYDVVEDKLNVIHKIPNLTFTSVFSGKTLISEILDSYKELEDKLPVYFKTNIDDLIFGKDTPRELTEMDYTKVAQDIVNILTSEEYYKGNKYSKTYLGKFFATLMLDRTFDKEAMSCCGSCKTFLNVDLYGNVYLCHNCDTIIGKYSSFGEVDLTPLQKIEEEKKCLRSKCKDCYVKDLCKGGCMLVSQEQRKAGYCEMKKALYTPVIDYYKQVLKGEIKNGNSK